MASEPDNDGKKVRLDELAERYLDQTLNRAIDRITVAAWLDRGEFFVVLRISKLITTMAVLAAFAAAVWRWFGSG